MLKFERLIERMSLEEKLSFILSDQKNKSRSLTKFDIPSVWIKKPEDFSANLLPQKIKGFMHSFNEALLMEYGLFYREECSKNRAFLRISLDDFFSSNQIVSIKMMKAFLKNIGDFCIIDLLQGNYEGTFYENIIKSVEPDLLLMASDILSDEIGLLPIKKIVIADDVESVMKAIERGSVLTFYQNEKIPEAIEKLIVSAEENDSATESQIKEEMINQRVNDLLELICRFDGRSADFEHYESDLEKRKHELEFSTKMAKESIVLLKNQDHLLPILKYQKLILFGNMTNSLKSSVNYKLFLEHMKNHQRRVLGYSPEYGVGKITQLIQFEDVTDIVEAADLFLIFTEDLKKDEYRLLIDQLKSYQIPIVTCLHSNVNFLYEDTLSSESILFYEDLGAGFSEALADILIGNYDPSGKLAYEIFEEKQNLYSFGHGLNYNNLEFNHFELGKEEVLFTLKNYSEQKVLKTLFLYATREKNQLFEKNLINFLTTEVLPNRAEKFAIPFESAYFQDSKTEYHLLIAEDRQNILVDFFLEVEEVKVLEKKEIIQEMDDVEIAMLDFEQKSEENFSADHSIRFSFKSKMLLILAVLMYYDILNIAFIFDDGFSISRSDLILLAILVLLNLIGVVYLWRLFRKNKTSDDKNIGKSYAKLLGEMKNFQEISKIVYEKPIDENLLVEMEETRKFEEPQVIFNANYIASDQERTIQKLEILEIKDLAEKFVQFAKKNQASIDIHVARNLFSCMAASNLVILKLNHTENLDYFQELIANFFGLEEFDTNLESVHEYKDLYWKTKKGESAHFEMTDFSKSLIMAESNPENMIVTFLNHLPWNQFQTFFDVHLNSIMSNSESFYIQIDSKREIELYKNLWYFLAVEENCEIPLKFNEVGVTLELNLSLPIMSQRLEKNAFLTVRDFNEAVQFARNNDFLSEVTWKSVDEFLNQVNTLENFKLNNKLLIQIERLSSVFKSFTKDENETLDYLLSSKVVPLIRNLNLYQNSRGDQLVTDILTKVFGEGILTKAVEALKK